MPSHKLSNAKVKNANPGKYGDGAGLQFVVSKPKNKQSKSRNRRWVLRYMIDSSPREMGLGSFPDVSLQEARERATRYRKLAKEGIDPIDFRKEERREKQLSKAQRTLFRECAADCIESLKPGWKNAKHADQWSSTLETYAYPVIGDKPVGLVDTSMVLNVLKPIWTEIPETASRVRGRIETVMDYAAAHGYRSGENPARWRGNLKGVLPERNKVAPVEHFNALPYDEIPEFFFELSCEDGLATKALQILILTAARTSEIIGSHWHEFDLEKRMWKIPGSRIKGGKEHRVPLTDSTLAIISELQESVSSTYVFPGRKYTQPMSNAAMLALLKRMDRSDITVHGFRSSFRDWAAEQTSFPREVAEAALAHVVADKVEAAYRRGDLFEKRRKLMTAWADFCLSENKHNVISFRRQDRKAS